MIHSQTKDRTIIKKCICAKFCPRISKLTLFYTTIVRESEIHVLLDNLTLRFLKELQ